MKQEHSCMTDDTALEAHHCNEVPAGTKIITNTWAMKKKASQTYQARLNALGFKQVNGERYDKTHIS